MLFCESSSKQQALCRIEILCQWFNEKSTSSNTDPHSTNKSATAKPNLIFCLPRYDIDRSALYVHNLRTIYTCAPRVFAPGHMEGKY